MYLKKVLDAQAIDAVRINLSVQEQKLRSEPSCDFCGDSPHVIYAASRMSTGQPQQCWRWMACTTCEHMVDNNQWDAVEQRTTARFKQFFRARVPGATDATITKAVVLALAAFHSYAVKA